ncbi:adenylyltransferase/cytidyltransferase family protein [Bacillus sp. ISL-18]|uniref:adenylyltransferase/cytidyltransferase family protein n=1 Tax=Bacillus sp. ISL-18 TaxID=2819118 RepID=UPI001BECA0BF|nr:adenylyltransferase/cytidyltransferase family protein [Bacillus sp. ISL-18]MBT2657091.1 adenylyltransferase/cytidyltransferase family protein [Bacillus sp. ISL-18]
MESKKYKVGYTTGVFDMFHIGHLNLLKNAKLFCDQLIVGVSTDELVKQYKNKNTIIPFEERFSIVESINYVNKVVPQNTMEKLKAWETLHFDVMFVGDDWKGTRKWLKFEEQFKELGVEIIYLPYSKQTSSTMLRELITKELVSK